MRPTRSVGQLAVALLSLTPAVSAMGQWPKWLPERDSLLVARQDDAPAPSPTPAATTAPATTGKPSVIQTNLNTGGITQTGTAGATGNSTRTSPPRKTMFNPVDPAGGVVMQTPAITSGVNLFKIGDYITLGWNYTNLQASPTAVDVLVSCAKAAQTYTLTQNMTFTTKGAFVWDTAEYQRENVAKPLPVEQYTLIIHDSEGSMTDAPEAGYLAPFTGFTFGLYTPRAYTPLGEWKCATCSAGVSDMERRALGGAVAMSVVTVLSFTWFVGGFGALL
ncbi:hypothetical protein QBC39DRAFT_349230 [Podospora conica]|nr:hypothetical protein QBC39DRAFT_349230 [Schizothecium conicum]